MRLRALSSNPTESFYSKAQTIRSIIGRVQKTILLQRKSHNQRLKSWHDRSGRIKTMMSNLCDTRLRSYACLIREEMLIIWHTHCDTLARAIARRAAGAGLLPGLFSDCDDSCIFLRDVHLREPDGSLFLAMLIPLPGLSLLRSRRRAVNANASQAHVVYVPAEPFAVYVCNHAKSDSYRLARKAAEINNDLLELTQAAFDPRRFASQRI